MFVRLTRGLKDTGKLIPVNESLDRFIESIESDYYVSPFKYTKEHKKIFKDQGGSVRGIRDVITDSLWWDFDEEKNPEHSREDSIKLCDKLISYGINKDDIYIAFSGNKGFEVSLLTDKVFTPDEVKNICSSLAHDLKTFDTSLYDANQIFRVTGTKHQKSGLYKTALTYDDLKDYTVDEIKEFAKTPRQRPTKNKIKLPKKILDIKNSEPPKPKVEVVELGDLDLTSKPKWIHASKWALQQGLYEEGEGNEARMILAATYKAQGFDRNSAKALIREAEQKRANRLGRSDIIEEDELERTVLNVVYSDLWTGGQYSPASNELLQKITARYGLKPETTKGSIMKLSDVAGDFRDFTKNLDQNRIFTGIKPLDEKAIITIGMPWAIVAASGSGKTSVVIDILKHNSQKGVQCLFASLDITRRRLYEKIALHYLTREHGRKELYKFYEQDSDFSKEIDEQIAHEYRNMFLFSQASPSVAQLSDHIKMIEDNTGEKLKFVAIDYFERLNSEYTDETAASKDIAGKLQDLVVEHDICLLTLLQPRKLSGDLSEPINSYLDIKGSSFIYQSLRNIFSMHREGWSTIMPENDKFLTIQCLKDDLAPNYSIDFHWDGRYGKISPLTNPYDIDLLRQLRKQKELTSDSSGFKI